MPATLLKTDITTDVDVATVSLLKKCPYSDFFWPVYSRIWTEHGDSLCKSPCSVQMR